jgi:integral membrane protein (TIGR01906 family)
MRILGIAGKWLFVLAMPVVLLTASIGWAVNSQWLYEYGFEKYNIGQTTGLAETELEKAASGLISYFNSGEDTISTTVIKDGEPFTLFNQREVAHLRDVKGLIRLDYWVLLGSAVYVLAYAVTSLLWQKDRRQLAWAVVGGGGTTLGLILLLGLAAMLNFDQFFLQFHLISFANDLWLLDPTKDYLIMLFPQGFWRDATMIIALVATGLALVLAGAGGAHLFFTGRKAKINPL